MTMMWRILKKAGVEAKEVSKRERENNQSWIKHKGYKKKDASQ